MQRKWKCQFSFKCKNIALYANFDTYVRYPEHDNKNSRKKIVFIIKKQIKLFILFVYFENTYAMLLWKRAIKWKWIWIMHRKRKSHENTHSFLLVCKHVLFNVYFLHVYLYCVLFQEKTMGMCTVDRRVLLPYRWLKSIWFF